MTCTPVPAPRVGTRSLIMMRMSAGSESTGVSAAADGWRLEMNDGAYGKRREAAQKRAAEGGPDYPRQVSIGFEVLCEHCESFGSQDCPLHRPRASSGLSRGLLQPIPIQWEKP